MAKKRHLRLAFPVALITLFLGPRPALAEEAPAGNNPPSAATGTNPDPAQKAELARFATFLETHPGIEARLRERPDLANDPVFQKNHPQIASFLNQHAGLAAELAARPRWFIHRELNRQASAPVTRGQVADFDRFLDRHPGVEKFLLQHPHLLRQPEFLKNQPELDEYLKQHPTINHAAESKPGRLMERERLHERIEKAKAKP